MKLHLFHKHYSIFLMLALPTTTTAIMTSRALVRAYHHAIRPTAQRQCYGAFTGVWQHHNNNKIISCSAIKSQKRAMNVGAARATPALFTSLDDYEDSNVVKGDPRIKILEDILLDDDVFEIFEEEDGIIEDGIESDMTSSTPQQDPEEIRKRLKEELKQYRIDQSSPLKKPAYTVFTNKALDEICASLPTNEDELLAVKGIGPKKLDSYGQDILNIVQKHTAKGGLSPDENHTTKKIVPRPPPIEIESLTDEQKRAAEVALNTKNPSNVFISGAAGVGKSHVAKYITQTMEKGETQQQRKTASTAPTGVAAINIGGSTLHSFFGIGLGLGSLQSLVKKVRKNIQAMKRIDETDVLLIDEVSMLSSDLLENLDAILREVRHDGEMHDKPMGGMQIVAIGDFFQLPPIIKREYLDGTRDVDEQRPFCFDSHVWEELGLRENTFELTEVIRQESGSRFELFLNMVRVGDVTADIIRDFNRKCLISKDHPLPEDGIVPTRIYTHNRDVDSENEMRLAELEGELIICKADDDWREAMPTGTLASVKKNMKASIAGELPDEVKLKIGAQVMLTRNKDLDSGPRSLVNGSRGVVERFDPSDNTTPFVRFDNGRVERISKVETVRYNPDGGVGALVRRQLPLKLAWATTVHKSQGSTLTRAIIDISSCFEVGQAYVSLSRVKSIDGLYLEKPVSLNNVLVSKRVLDYYNMDRNK